MTSFSSPSPSTTIIRCRRKSYNNLSLRRSARLAQHGVFKDLGIVGIDQNPNESSIQAYTYHLKALLPPNLVNKLLSLIGPAFWDFRGEGFFAFSLYFVFVVLGVLVLLALLCAPVARVLLLIVELA
jgi:hypothetical protein